MCGFSIVKDRRIIDPPLVLQLVARDRDRTRVHGADFGANTLCHISLWSADRSVECGTVVNPRFKSHMRSKQHRAADSSVARSNKHCQTIIGSTMLPPQTLADLDGTPGNFFVFHDLSIRVQGFYTLKCELLELDSSGPFPRFRSLHTIFTSPIHMFPPKFFPGMLESTPLSKCFAKQGMPIHIRRDYACLQSERDIAIPAVSHTNVVHDSA